MQLIDKNGIREVCRECHRVEKPSLRVVEAVCVECQAQWADARRAADYLYTWVVKDRQRLQA